jgi:predicted transcriptional regulator
MRSYRGRMDIIADILNVVSGNAKKTKIMYQANLSYKVLQKYLTDVREASLISYMNPEQYYVLTPKGSEFLKVYRDYSRTNKNVEKRLNDICSKRKVLEGLCPNK